MTLLKSPRCLLVLIFFLLHQPVVALLNGGLGLFNIFRPFETIKKRKFRCLFKFLRMDLNITDFDRYDFFLRNDSVSVLAQTGIYQGIDNIEEYTRFATDTAPYFDRSIEKKTRPYVLGYNSDTNQCDFLYLTQVEFLTSQITATRAERFDVAAMLKISLDWDANYFTRTNIFYSAPFLVYLFGELLSGGNTISFICNDVLNDVCVDVLGNQTQNCENELLSLPIVDADTYVDGNTLGCRALHAAFARTNPVNHCPHVALTPTSDPNGDFKCQVSEQISVDSLHDEFGLQFFEEFAASVGMDPSIGYKVLT